RARQRLASQRNENPTSGASTAHAAGRSSGRFSSQRRTTSGRSHAQCRGRHSTSTFTNGVLSRRVELMRPSFVLLLCGVAACSSSSSSSSPSSNSGDDGGASSNEPAFDACELLTKTEAQDVIGYELEACRKETVTDAVRHVFESPDSAPIAATGSVNIT